MDQMLGSLQELQVIMNFLTEFIMPTMSPQNSPLHVRCYLTDPSSPVQLSASRASPFPEKREWVGPSLLVAKTLFHHQAQLCDWTGQDLALHASSIFSSPSLSP